jgi:hypothetical protein
MHPDAVERKMICKYKPQMQMNFKTYHAVKDARYKHLFTIHYGAILNTEASMMDLCQYKAGGW